MPVRKQTPDLNTPLDTAATSVQQATSDLNALIEQTRQANDRLQHALDQARRAAGLAKFDSKTVNDFLKRPYLIRPLGAGEYELCIPSFYNFRAGWPLRKEGAYDVYLVSRFVHLLAPLPDWLAGELGFERPSFEAVLEGDVLTITSGDAKAVHKKLGGDKTIARREGNQLYLRPASRFDILRRIIREEGFLPFRAQPVPDDLLREPQIARDERGRAAFALRPHQERDYQRFLETSALAVFAYPQTGKSFIALQALAALNGPKLIMAPRRSLVDQWKARIELFLTPEAAAEVTVITYQGARKHLKQEWTLVVFDEVHHIPADFAVETAARIRTVTRIGLSATPRREDGNADLIPALAGFPVGMDWPIGEAQRPTVTVWIVKNMDAKLKLMQRLCAQPIEGKTFVFSYNIEPGRKAAQRLKVPFVFGGTKKPLDVIAQNDTVVISNVGDEGLSFPVRRVIELTFLFGSGMQAGQRLGRLAYEVQGKDAPGEHHILMTPDEYERYAKRLLIYEQWGLNIDVRVESGHVTTRKPAVRGDSRRSPKLHPEQSRRSSEGDNRRKSGTHRASAATDGETDDSLLGHLLALPSIATKIDRAQRQSSAPAGYVVKVFRLCYAAAFSPEEIVEGQGLSGHSALDRYRAACKALKEVGLLVEDGEGRFRVDQQEINRLRALADAMGK